MHHVGLGWRWHKWIAVILTGLNFLAVVFFVPETRYDRDYSESLDIVTHAPASPVNGAPALFDDKDKIYASTTSDGTSSPVSPSTPSRTLSDERLQVPKKTYLQQISLWSGTAPNTNFLTLFFRPFPMIVYPAVFYGFLAYAIILALNVAINILNSFILEAPPYNWSTSTDGLINIPGIIGNAIGAFCGGWCVDHFCNWRAKKNGGVFQPETRLVLLVVSVLVVPAGMLLFGYGVQNVLGWPSLFVGYGMAAFGLCAVSRRLLRSCSTTLLTIFASGSHNHNDLRQRQLSARRSRRSTSGKRAQEHCRVWVLEGGCAMGN